MDMIGVALALLSAASSGFSVVLVGRHSSKSSSFNISLIISCVGVSILWPMALLGTNFQAANIIGILLFALCGVLSPGIVRLLYYEGLKSFGTAVNSSIVSIYPLYTSLLAVLLLNETLSVENWVGILCIVMGIIFVEINSQKSTLGVKASKRRLIIPIVSGLTLGVASIIRKVGLGFFNAPIFGVAISYSFSLLPYLLIFSLHSPTRANFHPKRDVKLFWVAGIGQAVSWLTAFYALSFEKVSIVTPLISIEPVFVVFLAFLYLRHTERISSKLIASVVLTVLGVVLVSF
jgi:drug/metabolite transporter (DMT)-like permease